MPRIRRGITTQDPVHTTLGKFAEREGKLPTKLNEPWQSMGLPSTTHITTRMDEDMYQTVASYILDNYNVMGALNPAELLQHIGARLVTVDQLEFKRLRFELGKQSPEENP